MTRIIFLSLLNLLLPFVLYYLRHWLWVWWLNRNGDKKAEKHVPPLNVDIAVRLLGIGVLLLAISLLVLRFYGTP